jgi:multidrug efflux system membrane fusion protein
MTLIEEGVAVGERLVLEGTDRLRDGSVVEVIGEGQATTVKQTEARIPEGA